MKEQIIEKIQGYLSAVDEGLKIYKDDKTKKRHGGEDAEITMTSCKNMLLQLLEFVERQ